MAKADLLEFLQSHVTLFRGFPADRLAQMVDGSRVTTFEPKEAIVEFGEEGRFLAILLDGKAEVSVTDDSGWKHIIGTLRPGEVIGEMSLMTGDRTVADVIGTTRCKVLIVPQSVFSTVLITHPPAIAYLSRIIVERLKSASEERSRKLAASAFRRSDDPYGFTLTTDEPQRILVVNSGSSSLKYNIFDTADENRNVRGSIERIGGDGTRHMYRSSTGELVRDLPKGGHREAFDAMLDELIAEETGVIGSPSEITAVGHRVVHGGEKYNSATVITEEVLEDILQAAHLAPLHNPVNLTGSRYPRASPWPLPQLKLRLT